MRCTTPEEFNYFAINTRGKWREGLSESILIDSEGSLSLTPMMSISLLGDIGHATGLAVDNKGDLFIIDADNCQVYRFSAESQSLQRLECFQSCGDLEPRWEATGLFGCGGQVGEFKFKNEGIASGGLAFGKHALYVADPFNHRVQGFYLPQFQIRFVLGKRGLCGYESGSGKGEFNHPKDLVTDSRGYLYVLDYGNNRVQKFNRFGRFVQFFGTEGYHALKKPESLAVDKDDFIYVIDSETATVERFNSKGEHQDTPVKWAEQMAEQFPPDGRPTQPSAIAVDQDKIIYVAEKGQGDLSIHQFDQDGRYLGRFGKYSHGCFKLVVDREGRLYGSCGPNGEVILFAGDDQFEAQGAYYSKVFDSTIEACLWHRLDLDIQPAEKSTLDVLFRTSDEKFSPTVNEKALEWSHLFNTPHKSGAVNDALFRDAAGRYLQLKLIFSGDRFHTHKVKQARLYFQRLSYLRYLPATYQEDAEGRDLLERFLSIFESMSYEIEQTIAGVAQYFDPEAVNSEFLDWLGTWLAVLRDYNWPEDKRREFLKNAYRLYKVRGTVRGLKEMVELFTGGEALIIEHYRLQTPMVLSANSTLGASTVVGKRFGRRLVIEESSTIGEFALIEADDPPEKPFEANAFDFTILADTSQLENEAQLEALRRLVEAEKPAHTRCCLRAGGGVMQLGRHALLGVDSKLAKGYETARLGLTSQIGKGTFLGTRFRQRGVIGARSAIAVDAILH